MSFPRYSDYRDSCVEWLGDVPAHWSILPFRRCVQVAEGQVDPEVAPYAQMALIAPNHVESGTGRLLAKETAEEQGAESGKYICDSGNVIYSKIRPGLRKACLAPERCLCSADMYPLQPHSGMTNRFLLWFLLSEQFSSFAVLESDRVAMPKINRDSLGAVWLVRPPEKEQEQIAAFLDRETGKIDALVAEQEKLIALLKEKRQAVISHAVTKGLDPTVPMKDSGIEWLGEVPERWDVVRLKRLTVLQRGHDLPADAREEGDIPVVSSGGYLGTHNTAQAKAPGVVTGRYGTIGEFIYVDRDYWPLNTALYTVEMHGNNPRYVWYALRSISEHFVLNSLKSAVPGVDRNDVHDVFVARPPVTEQALIADFLDREMDRTEELAAEARRAIDLLQERRAALISAAVTGKIAVRDLVGVEAA